MQGEVAADALLHERDARERLVTHVRSTAPHRPISTDFKPKKVVYAIALDSGKPLTADTLFTFSQVALYRAARRLRSDGIDVEVVGIPTGTDGEPSRSWLRFAMLVRTVLEPGCGTGNDAMRPADEGYAAAPDLSREAIEQARSSVSRATRSSLVWRTNLGMERARTTEVVLRAVGPAR